MFRSVISKCANTSRSFLGTNSLVKPGSSALVRCSSVVINPGLAAPKHGRDETDDEFDARYVAYFNRADIDGWEIRKGINDLQRMDLVPDPTIVIAALKACRRVNDYSLCVRILEAIKFKCAEDTKIFPYIMQEIRPTLDELGISTPEEMGFDKPELAMVNPYDVHG